MTILLVGVATVAFVFGALVMAATGLDSQSMFETDDGSVGEPDEEFECPYDEGVPP